jgi:hypothetical protein
MSIWAALIHLANFVYPAVGLAVLVSLVARWLAPASGKGLKLPLAIALNSAAGVLVLIGGFVIFGNDGKMATYGALVFTSSVFAYVAQGVWRK